MFTLKRIPDSDQVCLMLNLNVFDLLISFFYLVAAA